MRKLTGLVLLTFGPVAAAQHPPQPSPLMRVNAYGASWVDPEDPPPARQQAPAGDDRLDRIERKLDELISLLRGQAQQQQGGEEDEAAQAEHLKQLSGALSKCRGCHAPDTKTKGDGFAVMENFRDRDGKTKLALRENFTRRNLQNMIEMVTNEDMPKKGRLTEKEKNAFVAEMKARLEQIEGK